MSTLVDEAWHELQKLPVTEQEALARDLLELIRSERGWDQLFADPRSGPALRRLAAEADRDEVYDIDPSTRPQAKAGG